MTCVILLLYFYTQSGIAKSAKIIFFNHTRLKYSNNMKKSSKKSVVLEKGERI